MALNFDLDLKNNKLDRLYFYFVLGSTTLGAISFTLLPMITSWAFLSLGLMLYSNYEKFTDLDKIKPKERFANAHHREQPVDAFTVTIDLLIKLSLGLMIFMLGFFFSFSHSGAHFLLGGAACFFLSRFFINDCVIEPQARLNKAYRNEKNKLRKAIYLDRGAQPDMPLEKVITPSNIFSEFKKLGSKAVSTAGRQWLTALRPILFTDRSRENLDRFYDASFQLWKEINTPITNGFNLGFTYLQQQTYELIPPTLPDSNAQTQHRNDVFSSSSRGHILGFSSSYQSPAPAEVNPPATNSKQHRPKWS